MPDACPSAGDLSMVVLLTGGLGRIKLCTDPFMADDKQIRWAGSAYNDQVAFPENSRREAGFQLGKVQAGLDPADGKPFDGAR